jgi:hypothetical protein
VKVRASQPGTLNYEAAQPVDRSFTVFPRPMASISLSSRGDLVVSWPTNVAGFYVESTASLEQPVWSILNLAPVIVNDRFSVTAPSGNGPQFYRLRN